MTFGIMRYIIHIIFIVPFIYGILSLFFSKCILFGYECYSIMLYVLLILSIMIFVSMVFTLAYIYFETVNNKEMQRKMLRNLRFILIKDVIDLLANNKEGEGGNG